MAEVARAVVLPEVSDPSLDAVLTLALLWDGVEVVLVKGEGDAAERARSSFGELIEHGVVTWSIAPRVEHQPPGPDDEYQGRVPDLRTRDDAERFARYAATAMALWNVELVRLVQADADRRGLASVALTPFASAAASLPPRTAEGPQAEAALIQAAAAGVTVLPGTTPSDVLAFREKNAPLMGRLRAQMVDLAQTMRSDGSPEAIMEQAHAVIKNRVEPVLGQLEDVLRRSRIRYAWSMLFGASAVLLGPASTTIAASGGGRIAAKTLDYVFDRERLIRDHPYGLLHVLRSEMDQQDTLRHPSLIEDPITVTRDIFQGVLQRVLEAEIKPPPGA